MKSFSRLIMGLIMTMSFGAQGAGLEEAAKAAGIPVEAFVRMLEVKAYVGCYYGPVDKISNSCLGYHIAQARRCVFSGEKKYGCDSSGGSFGQEDRNIYVLKIALSRKGFFANTAEKEEAIALMELLSKKK